ncbi:unnamed protein product [Effrenium voratum]|nr:unnamed protein product [Effrenium voratum]
MSNPNPHFNIFADLSIKLTEAPNESELEQTTLSTCSPIPTTSRSRQLQLQVGKMDDVRTAGCASSEWLPRLEALCSFHDILQIGHSSKAWSTEVATNLSLPPESSSFSARLWACRRRRGRTACVVALQ